MPQGQPVRAELVLEVRAEDAALHAGGPTGRVDLEDPVEPPEVEGDRRAVEARLDAADDRAAAAVRHDGDPLPAAPLEDGRDLVVVTGPDDDVR